MSKDLALKYADQVANALRGKFPEYKVYVRHVETSDLNFIEIAAKNKKNEECTVAYSEAFFAEMTDVAVKQARAKRVYSDLKVHMGIEDE